MSEQEGESENLELPFGNIEDENAQKRAIEHNRMYRTMPAVTIPCGEKSQAWLVVRREKLGEGFK